MTCIKVNNLYTTWMNWIFYHHVVTLSSIMLIFFFRYYFDINKLRRFFFWLLFSFSNFYSLAFLYFNCLKLFHKEYMVNLIIKWKKFVLLEHLIQYICCIIFAIFYAFIYLSFLLFLDFTWIEHLIFLIFPHTI